MEKTFLIVHLLGAVVVLGLAVASLLSLNAPVSNKHVTLAKTLAYGSIFQVLSGGLLAFASSSSVSSFCLRIGFYVAVIASAEAALYVKLRGSLVAFPARAIASSSLLFSVLLISSIFVLLKI